MVRSGGAAGRVTDPTERHVGRIWTGLPELVARTGRLDRVELKIQLATEGATVYAVAAALGMVQIAERSHDVYFFDRPDLALHRNGLIARARVNSLGRADLACKLRRRHPCRLPRRVRRSPRLSVELDALPHRTWWCASVKHRVPVAVPRAARHLWHTWSEVCSAEQRVLLRPLLASRRGFGGLSAFGPVRVRKLVGEVAGLGDLALESWRYPDGRRLLELSTKCRPGQVNRTAKRIRRLLVAATVPLSPQQGTKTKAALHHHLGRPGAAS